MSETRAPIIFALLMLLFFVSTSAGFADVSSIQEQLRGIQFKLIREKIKLLQEGIIEAGKQQVKEREVAKASQMPLALVKAEPNRDELARTLEAQIRTLQGVVATLRPRSIEQRTAEIENRIGGIKEELKTAAGAKLAALQDELNGLLAQYEALQEDVRQALAESITYRQALVIGEQIRAVQAKVQILPQEAKAAPAKVSPPAVDPAVRAVEAEVEKLRLRVLQAQAMAIQEKINQLTSR